MRLLFDRFAAERSGQSRAGAGGGVLERHASELRRAQRRVIPVNFDFQAGARGCMQAPMKKLVLAALALATPAPLFAGAANFTLVNGTEGALAGLSIRRVGTQDWKALGAAPSAGARGSVSFSDPDCAFDLQATVQGSAVTWAGVNLCDVKSVTLRRDPSAGAWVDYDQ